VQSTVETRNGHSVPYGPSDREVVAYLQRLASARAQLLTAEEAAAHQASAMVVGVRNAEVEDAHAELLWAQAQLLTGVRESKAQRAVEQARDRERQVLRRYGYSAYRDYQEDRTGTPTADTHLEVARHEYADALANWEALQAAMHQGRPSGANVIDLTGNPRRIA